MESRVISDVKPLNKFIENISKKHILKVGIFAENTARKETEKTNAEIGAINEFGSFSDKIPARSFLRMPLHSKSEKIKKLFAKSAKPDIENGDIKLAMKKLGIACEVVIQEAFESKGFGKWPANSPVTISLKGSSSPLIDTGELRKSISSKVE